MNASNPVVACSTCGALYSPVSGDQGHCAACSLLLDDSPAPVASPKPRAASGHALTDRPLPGDSNQSPGATVTHLEPRRPRSLRRVVVGFVAVGLVALLGTGIALRRQELADAWSAARRHSPREAWTAARRLASDGWSALRRRLPFDALQPERSVPAPPAKRVAVKTRKNHQKH